MSIKRELLEAAIKANPEIVFIPRLYALITASLDAEEQRNGQESR